MPTVQGQCGIAAVDDVDPLAVDIGLVVSFRVPAEVDGDIGVLARTDSTRIAVPESLSRSATDSRSSTVVIQPRRFGWMREQECQTLSEQDFADIGAPGRYPASEATPELYVRIVRLKCHRLPIDELRESRRRSGGVTLSDFVRIHAEQAYPFGGAEIDVEGIAVCDMHHGTRLLVGGGRCGSRQREY